jgi:hypothetical protein
VSDKRYTDIGMENRYTNGHSLVPLFVRIEREQKEYLDTLPKGEVATFVRQAISDKISNTVTLESGNKKAVMINSIEEKNKRKIGIQRELDRLEEFRRQLIHLEGLGFETIRKYSDGEKPIITIEQKSILWNDLSAETRGFEQRQHARIYGKPLVVTNTERFHVTCPVVVFQYGDEANTIMVEAGFLSNFRRKNEKLDDTARRLYSEYLEQKGIFEVTIDKIILLTNELMRLEDEIKESIAIYKDHTDIQISPTEPATEPLKRGASQVEAV